jgi:hypothetical protein
MYSPRSDEWDRLPWLTDLPRPARRRNTSAFPIGWIELLMAAVAVGSFWAGSTSIRAENRAADSAPSRPDTSSFAVEPLQATTLTRRHPSRADVPY